MRLFYKNEINLIIQKVFINNQYRYSLEYGL